MKPSKEELELLDINEAPPGYHAVLKSQAPTPNPCDSCDARQLCIENKDNWCMKHRCMSQEVICIVLRKPNSLDLG
jgi:hypothetical protein